MPKRTGLKQYGKFGGVDRVYVTGMDFEQMRELIRTKPDQVTDQAAEALRIIAADGVRNMRQTIQGAVTKTGETQMRLGYRATPGRVRGRGEPSLRYRPRIAGRSMLDSVDQEVKVNKRSVSMRFGWLSGRPGYAYFQEFGTSNGVEGMHALRDAKVQAELDLMKAMRKLK
jgi:hypothetical protein